MSTHGRMYATLIKPIILFRYKLAIKTAQNVALGKPEHAVGTSKHMCARVFVCECKSG